MKTLFLLSLIVVLFCVNQSYGRVARSDDEIDGTSSTVAPGESTDAPKQVSDILMPGPALIDEKTDGDSIASKIDNANSDSIGSLAPQKDNVAPSIVKPVSSLAPGEKLTDSTNDEVNEGGKDLDIKTNAFKPVQNEQTVKNIPEINTSTKTSEDDVKTETANSMPSQIITNQNKDVINSETKSDNIENSLKADNIPNLLMPGPVMAGGEIVNDPADTSDRDGAVDPLPDQGISKQTSNPDQVSVNKETDKGQTNTKTEDSSKIDSSSSVANSPGPFPETKDKEAEVPSQSGTEVKPLLTDSNGQTYLNPNILMPGPALIEEKTDKSSVSGETDTSVNNTDKNVTTETPAIKPNEDNPSIDTDTTNKIIKPQPTDNQPTDSQKNDDIIPLTNSIIVSNAKTDKSSSKTENETIPSNSNNDLDEGKTLTDNLANNDVNGNTIETPDDKGTGDHLLSGDNAYNNQNKEGKDILVENTSKNMNPTTSSIDNDNDNKSDEVEDSDNKENGDNQDNLPDNNGMFDDTDNDKADNDVINDNGIDDDNGDVDDDTDHVGDDNDDDVDNDIMDDGDQVNDDDDYDYSDDFEENWWDDTDDDNYDDDDDYDDNDMGDYSDDSAVDLDDIAEEVDDEDDDDDDDNGDGATRDYDYNGDNDQYDDMLPIDKSHTDTEDNDNEEEGDEKNNISLGDGDQADLYDDDNDQDDDDEKNNISLGNGDQADLYDDNDDDDKENEEAENNEEDKDGGFIADEDNDDVITDSNDEDDLHNESEETVDEDTGVDNMEGGKLTNLDINSDGDDDDSAVITDKGHVKSSKPSESRSNFGDNKQWREINTEVKRASAYSWVLFFTVIVITLLFVAYLNKSKLNKFFAPAAPPRRKLGDEEKNLLAYEYD